jgi:hypothetical protein
MLASVRHLALQFLVKSINKPRHHGAQPAKPAAWRTNIVTQLVAAEALDGCQPPIKWDSFESSNSIPAIVTHYAPSPVSMQQFSTTKWRSRHALSISTPLLSARKAAKE